MTTSDCRTSLDESESVLYFGGHGPSFAGLAVVLVLLLGACRVDDRARIPKDVILQEANQLSPPRVGKPIHECAEAVYVYGFAPGAVVRVYVGVEEVGVVVPHFGFADISLTRALDIGESVEATQEIDGVESGRSINPVSVEAWPPGGTLPKLDVGDELYACGRVVPVGNLLESSRVKVTEDGTLRGQAESPGTWHPVFTNAGLTEGRTVSAQAFACEGDPARELRSDPAEGVRVLPVPDPMEGPQIDPNTAIGVCT